MFVRAIQLAVQGTKINPSPYFRNRLTSMEKFMDLHLNKKTAVITGASQGFGRAIAKELAREGVRVFVTARNAALLNSLKNEIVAEGGSEPVISYKISLPRIARKQLPVRHLLVWARWISSLIILVAASHWM